MKPVLQALVLAEHVYEDKTGKKIIAGTFNAIEIATRSAQPTVDEDGAQLVPAGEQIGSLYAYVSLTDVGNDTELVFQLVQLNKNVVLYGTKPIPVKSPHRLAAVELVVPLPPMEHALNRGGAGTYAFEILCEGGILGSWRITVTEEPNAYEGEK